MSFKEVNPLKIRAAEISILSAIYKVVGRDSACLDEGHLPHNEVVAVAGDVKKAYDKWHSRQTEAFQAISATHIDLKTFRKLIENPKKVIISTPGLRLIIPRFLGISQEAFAELIAVFDAKGVAETKKEVTAKKNLSDKPPRIKRTDLDWANLFEAKHPKLWKSLQHQYRASTDNDPSDQRAVYVWLIESLSQRRRSPIPTVEDAVKDFLQDRKSKYGKHCQDLADAPPHRPSTPVPHLRLVAGYPKG